jgi:hypothetical protein
MNIRRIFLSTLLSSLLFGLAGGAMAVDGKKTDYKVGDRLQQNTADTKSTTYKTITWDDLMPKGWDPMTEFKKIDFSKMKDSDPRAQDALVHLRETWNNSPVEQSMSGARIRIPGFIVPLEEAHHQISEFLLVPYFGGCIHVPPPPANQIIHVFPIKPLKKELQSMDAVWISGVLETLPSDTGMGSAGYRMKADVVVPYPPDGK